MTVPVYREDAYRREVEASVLAIRDDGGCILDMTVFYPQGGGQPGDSGWLITADGDQHPVGDTRLDADRQAIVHMLPPGAPLKVGERVIARVDWSCRYPRMRIHTALHLLSVVLPFPVTGGAIGEGEGRLDFDIPDAGLDKNEIADALNALIAKRSPVRERWITDAELDANPALVKTMSVKPPRGSGRIRLVEIEGIDLQPCGGTHVSETGEIGPIVVTDIQKKGKMNRRVRIALA